MSTDIRLGRWLLILTALGFSVTGCSSGLIKVKGKVVTNGEPVREGKRQTLVVTFFPMTKEGIPDLYEARVNGAEGTFEVHGKKGKGIPPGQYRVGVQLLVDPNDKDLLRNKFAPNVSTIMRDVDSENREVVIDLAKEKPSG